MKTRILGIIAIIFCSLLGFGQCKITELAITTTECNSNGKFFVTINFAHVGTSPKFKIIGNGKNYGTFEYSNLPITLGPLTGDCTTNYEFLIRDIEFESCTAFKNTGTKCCTDECAISFKNVASGNCDGMLYQLSFDLDYTSEPTNGFDLYTNGQFFGYYKYDELPLHITDFPSSSSETYNQVVVCANDNPTCCDTIQILNPCICSIYKVQGQVINCNEETKTFSIKLNFKHNLTADSFQIGGNTTNYGTYAYTDLPITITGLHFSDLTQYEFLILDKNNTFCFAAYELGIVKNCNFECNISELIIEPHACEDGKFYVDLAFDYKNTSIAGFSVVGNGQTYGSFEYGEQFYKLGPLDADCTTLYEFVVKDKELLGCQAARAFNEPICCNVGCEIAELRIEEICENNILVGFQFNFNHTSTEGSFVIKANGVTLGTYKYSDLPVTINQINFNGQQVNFVIFDSVIESCNLKKSYTFECQNKPDCDIRDMILTAGDCNDDGQFYAKLKFKVTSPGAEGFIIKVNGIIFDTLQYGQDFYQIGPLDGDCSTLYQFLMYDVQHPECVEDYKFTEKVCCDEKCKISNALLTFLPCKDGKFDVKINVDHQGASAKFRIRIKNQFYGPFSYADLPYTIEGLSERQVYEIVIVDAEDESCRLVVVIPAIECSSSTNDGLAATVNIKNNNEILEISLAEIWGNTKVSLLDITGKLITSKSLNSEYTTLELHQLSAGLYLLRIENKEITYTKKIVKY